MLRVIDAMFLQLSRNKAFNGQIPLLNIPVSKVISFGTIFTGAIHKYFLMAQPFNDRQTKYLTMKASEG
jgi:hypothetical protein